MTKSDVRSNFPGGLIAGDVPLSELLEKQEVMLDASSGSTGGRLEFIGYPHRPAPYALYRRHPVMRAAADPDSVRIARFTTPVCSGAVCHRTSPYEERVWQGGKFLNVSSSERIWRLQRDELETILDEFERFQPHVLYLDPVYGVALVRALQRHDLPVPRVSGIFATYEFLSVLHRDVLSEAFGTPIYQLYCATEILDTAAFTCEKGRFHVLDETHVFEFIRNDRPVAAGEVGEIAVTTLWEPYSRFVRYRVGDLGTPIEEVCGCQFDDLPSFFLEGRAQATLMDEAGNPVTPRAVDEVFGGLHWIDCYQLVQRHRDRYQLLAVPRLGSERARDEQIFLERARELLGKGADIRIEYVRELAPYASSLKYPTTKNALDTSWRP